MDRKTEVRRKGERLVDERKEEKGGNIDGGGQREEREKGKKGRN